MILILLSFFYQSLSYLLSYSSFQNYHTTVAFVGQNTTSNENHTPAAEDMTILTNSSNPVRFTLKAQDEDKSDKLNYSIVTKPKYGEVSFFDSTTGDIIYNPGGAFLVNNDSLAFRVNDDNGAVSNPGLVIIKPGT